MGKKNDEEEAAEPKADPKKAARQAAVSLIEKQHGKGSIQRLGDAAPQVVDSFSTGSLTLDMALGVGGYPKGRVIEIYGPEAGGKCLTADAYISTPSGLLTVKELFEKAGQVASCTSRTTVAKMNLINRYCDVESTTEITHNNKRPVFEVETFSGTTLKTTANHPHLVMNKRGQWVWRKVSNLSVGDYLVCLRDTTGRKPRVATHSALESEEAYALGLLIADGALQETRIGITNDDPCVLTFIAEKLPDILGVQPRKYQNHGSTTSLNHHFNSKEKIGDFYERTGLSPCLSKEKTIPLSVRTSKSNVLRSFLRGYFDCECYIDEEKPCIEVTSASEELLRQVKILLLSFGIVSLLRPKEVKDYPENDYWRLTVSGDDARLYADIIGTSSALRKDKLDLIVQSKSGSTNFDSIPHCEWLLRDLSDASETTRDHNVAVCDYMAPDQRANLTAKRLERILCDHAWSDCSALSRLGEIYAYRDLYFYDCVVSITEQPEPEPTFDFVCPESHSFVANGIVTHNTTLTLHAIAEIQKKGGACAFIDAEHALDLVYARNLGVKTDDLYLAQPDSGEQALEIVDTLVSSGGFDLVVVDSVAALVPRAEIEGEMGDSHMGLQARLMSQALRKLTSIIGKSKTTVIFINQLRQKIGVMFGCFHYNARVVLANGTTEKIGKIVNQKKEVDVLSFDIKTGKCEPRKIVSWHDNGNADYFLQFEVGKCGGNGVSRFGVTPNHMIFTPSGERPAGELEVGDEVWGKGLVQFTPLQRQVAIGSVLGDGSIRKTGNHTVQLRIGHGPQQIDYARWKAELFGDTVRWSGNVGDGGWGFDTRPSVDLISIRHGAYYWDGMRMISESFLEELNLLGVAIWYMDDACFSGTYERWGHGKVEIAMKSYRQEEREMVARRLVEMGLPEPTVTSRETLLWSGKRTHELQKMLAPFIHPTMEYKLHPNFRGQFQEYEDVERVDRFEMVPVPITNIYVKPKTRTMRRFDLTVAGNHSYIVDGVGVHNSNETTTGGNALKFYASVRLDIRRIGALKKGDDVYGNRVRIKVVKNKLAPPFKQAEIDLVYGRGFDPCRETLDLGVDFELVDKKGSYYSYDGTILGQGKDNAVQDLIDNEERYEALREAVLRKMAEKRAALFIPAGKPPPTMPSLPGSEKMQAPEPSPAKKDKK